MIKRERTYKIKFNEYQHNTLKTLEFAKPKVRKLMSIYSYLIKYSENGKVTKSQNRLHEMYVRYHEKVSNRYFYEIVNELEYLNLVKKVDNEIFIIEEPTTKVDTKAEDQSNNDDENVDGGQSLEQRVEQSEVQNDDVAETVENTNVEEETETPNNNTNSNIYTNTLNTQHNNEIVAPVELVYIAKNLLKDLKVRSVVVIDKVIEKLRNCFNVNRAGAEKYILRVIEEKRVHQEVARANFRNRVALQTSIATTNDGYGFNNFAGRQYTKEQYKAFEDALSNRF